MTSDNLELWQTINGHPKYEVSNLGRVRNKDRGNFLKGGLTLRGYRFVFLGQGNPARVHRLVAEHFVPGEGPVVRHLDSNRINNVATNLAWGTYKENTADMMVLGRHYNGTKTHCKYGHEFNLDNTQHTSRGYRRCRECRKRER